MLLSGCGVLPPLPRPTTPTSVPTSTTQISSSTSTTETTATTVSSSQTSSQTSATPITTTSSGKDLQNLEVNLTALNDFHGYVDEVSDRGYVGLAKLSTYLKNRKSNGDVLINSGDTYQGTFVSNYTQGSIITEVFKDVGFDAITIGNHEFDWGQDAIRYNESIFGQAFLGANIYNYPKGNEWTKSDLGDLYRIATINPYTDAEIKVGIIGVIGKDQITSITSTKVEDVIFLDPTPIIQSLSDELRAAGCDIIVADYHSADIDPEIASVSPISNKKYVDAVFAAHTHQLEAYTIGAGVPVVQGGENGEAVSKISLKFNKLTGETSAVSYSYHELASEFLEADPVAKAKIDEIERQIETTRSKIVGNAQRRMYTDNVSRFYAKIAAEKAAELGHNVDYVLFNNSRESLSQGDFTYEDLFLTHPFKNELYILSCTEQNVLDEIGFGLVGYNCTGVYPESSTTSYKNVLVYDYVGFHQNVNENYEKYYNYFATAFTYKALHTPILIPNVNVFDLALDWLEINHTIKSTDYSGSNFF